MKVYRLFLLADTGHVLGPAQELRAEDDGRAVRAACERVREGPVELWDGPRYVGTLTGNPVTAHSDWIIVVRE